MLIAVNVLSAGLYVGIVLRYFSEIKLAKYKGDLTRNDDMFTTGKWKSLIIDLILYSL